MIENAAYEVATQIRTVEDGIDGVIAEAAELQARVMRVNSIAHAGVGTIHQSRATLAATLNNLVEARGSIVACHAARRPSTFSRCVASSSRSLAAAS